MAVQPISDAWPKSSIMADRRLLQRAPRFESMRAAPREFHDRRWSPRVVAIATCIVLVAALTGCLPNPAPVEAGCSTVSTTGLESRTIGGRNYLLFVPPGVPASGEGVPVMINLHGLNSNAAQMASYTPWPALAAQMPFIVAYPNAVNAAWNHSQGSTDVAFIRNVIAEIESTYCTDKSRVHVVGHSLGGYMAQRMACDAPDVVASVAEYAGGPPTMFYGNTPCTPSQPISVAIFHGDADRLVVPSLGVSARNLWLNVLNCETAPGLDLALGGGTSLLYGGCDDHTNVLYRTYTGQGHLWPTGANGIDQRDLMWEFLMSQFHTTR